jgi:hypothetical protein
LSSYISAMDIVRTPPKTDRIMNSGRDHTDSMIELKAQHRSGITHIRFLVRIEYPRMEQEKADV